MKFNARSLPRGAMCHYATRHKESSQTEETMSACVRLTAFLLSTCLATVLTPAQAHDDDDLEIVMLSNRADLVSGGDALIEVRVPKHVALNKVKLNLNGRDVTG